MDEIVQSKPHLKETLDLYRKVQRFKEIEIESRGVLPSEGSTYSDADARRITGEFAVVFGVDQEYLQPLKGALISNSIDLRRLPLGELPSSNMPYHEEELVTLLFIIAKPFFLSEHAKLNLDAIFWTEGKCPVCNAVPAVSVLVREGKRRFYCPFCETFGYWNRIGCPYCLTESHEDMSIITLAGEEGMRIDACNRCMNYYKSFNDYLIDEYTSDLLDLISLPLDIIAQGKGFKRYSPNPIGMIRMS